MQKNTSVLVNILLILLILNVLLFGILSNSARGEEETIYLVIANAEHENITEINERETFIVSVINTNDSKNPFMTDVEVTFNSQTKNISEETNREAVFSAPAVDKNKEFTITATKNGLIDETTILVKNLNLQITPSSTIIEENKWFSIVVTDGEEPVGGVRVYIQNYPEFEDITDTEGFAQLKAPNDKEKIKIIANYNDYAMAEKELIVNIEPSFIDRIFESEYTPIAFAVIILIGVVLYVNHRQKKAVYVRAEEITKQKRMDRLGLSEDSQVNENNNKQVEYNKEYSSLDQVRINSKPDSKVEEIRISRPKKKKEVVPIKTDEDKTNEILSKRKNKLNNNNDWFEGKDDIKYEINKLTGEIDEERLDKWFEGVEGLKEKIDKKVKKDKKKREEEKE